MKLNRNKMAMLMIAIMVTSVVMTMASAQVTVLDNPPDMPVKVKGDVTYANGTRVPNGWLVTLTDVTEGTELGNDTTEDKAPQIKQYEILVVPPTLIIEGHVIKASVSNGEWTGNVTHEVQSNETAPGSKITMDDIVVSAGEEPVLTTIEVSPSTKTLNVDATQEFTATAKDQNGNEMSGVVINWTSSNTTVGTVSPVSATTGDDGTATTTLTALAIGTTTVTAVNGTVNDTASVTVVQIAQLTIADLKAEPSTGVNKDNPTTVSATITSGAELELVTLYAIDTTNYQPKQYTLYAEDIPIGGDDYSSEWDATEFEVKNATTSSGTKPVFVGKTDKWDSITYYSVLGNLTINTTSGTAVAVALFDKDDLKLSKLIDPLTKESYSVEPESTTFAPFAVDATNRDSITDIWALLGSLEPLDAVTLTGTAPDYSISLVKTQVPVGDYTVGMAALDKAENNATGETTVSVSAGGANIKYSALGVAPTSGVAPLEITASAKVENTGDEAGDYNASFKIDDVIKEWSNGTLDTGENTTVSFDYNLTELGTYNVAIANLQAIEVEVTSIIKYTLDVTPKSGYAPLTITVSAKVENKGDTTHDYNASFKIDGAVVDWSNGTLDAGKDTTVSFVHTLLTEGTYNVAIADSSAVKVEVTKKHTGHGGGGGGGGIPDTDGDGYTDIEEMIMGTDPLDPCDPNPECVACTGAITEVITERPATPTPKLKPTPKPTIAPTTPEPKPEEPEKPPGFEAVFAIAGLLAVAYLALRRKK